MEGIARSCGFGTADDVAPWPVGRLYGVGQAFGTNRPRRTRTRPRAARGWSAGQRVGVRSRSPEVASETKARIAGPVSSRGANPSK
ncbi:hypothetical protein ABIA38_004478 [Embleya sp. AB8]